MIPLILFTLALEAAKVLNLSPSKQSQDRRSGLGFLMGILVGKESQRDIIV